ncbi:MAG: sigma-70 family RNA polymerase sigma factor [Cellulosimicrobium cellulans]
MRPTQDVPVEVVLAARSGDPEALDRLVAQSLPLVYNVVGRALDGHPDTDDVVQESVLRVVRGLGSLERPQSFRAWLLAITVRQVRDWMRRRRVDRERHADLSAVELAADPAADFVATTIDRLFLDGERRVLARATRWLDPRDRDVLALWWLESAGELTRAELAESLGVERRHAAVRVQRMRERLATGRAIVVALDRTPPCAGLTDVARRWDGLPSPLWRKRMARHVLDCPRCGGLEARSPERLLAGLPLLVPPAPLAGAASRLAVEGLAGAPTIEGLAGGSATEVLPVTHPQTRTGLLSWVRSPLRTALVTGAAAAAVGVVAALALGGGPAPTVAAPVPTAGTATTTPPREAAPDPSPEPAETPVEPPTVEPAPASPEAPSTAPGEAPGAAADPGPTAPPSGKKGAAVWAFDDAATALTASGAAWYYTWGTDPGPGAASGVEFVPMIWGRDHVTDENLARAASQGRYLLGFNEPDLAGQAEMSVEEALALWPRLEATGQVLGSPAVAWGGDAPDGWLDRFLRGADERGYRVDFVTLHWYGGDFDATRATDQLRRYLEAVHARYGKPIWLTEVALIDFSQGVRHASEDEQAAFLAQAARMLAGLDYVHRYAWFGLPAEDGPLRSGLYGPGGVATPVGRAFEAAP